VRKARRRLPRIVHSYVAGGTEDEATLRANRACFDRLPFRPRGLMGVADRSQSVSLWGADIPSPLGIAPMGVTAICRRNCDLALARAAHSRGLPFIASGASTVPIETLQEQVGGIWYQGYLPGDTDRLERIVQRLSAAQIEVLVVTSDTPVAANRENNQRNGFTIPFRPSWALFWDGLMHPRWSFEVFFKTLMHDGVPHFANLAEEVGSPITTEPAQGFRGGRDRLTWEHMSWLRDRWPGKLVVKGIVHPRDAEEAVARGMDGIVISNHGGRQLDGAVSSLEALAAIRPELPVDFPVMIDGGFRRGTDVLKAVALGARLVFVGRPVLYGASLAGSRGAGRVLDILMTEIDRNLALLGCADIADLDESFLDTVALQAMRPVS